MAALVWYFWDDLKKAFNASVDKVNEVFQPFIDQVKAKDWSGLGLSIMIALLQGMKKIGTQIADFFLSLIPAWARRYIIGNSENVAQPNSVPVQPPSVQRDVPLPPGQAGSTALTDDALDLKFELQKKEWEKMTMNLEKNVAKMAGSEPINATITDSRQDNRQFPFESNVTINQNVQQATDAPDRAASATAQAVGSTVAGQRSQVEAEPSMI